MNKGIILAGGNGTRLAPLTTVVNKHLLPINERFIIDYPINTLKKMGCKHITIILGGNHFDQVAYYLKDGTDWGVKFNYVYQGKPSGIAQAINLCKPYVEDEENFAVILGDNVFEKPIIWDKTKYFNPTSAKIVLYNTPGLSINRFGVVSLDQKEKIVNIIEKPKVLNDALRNYVITGCYVFNRDYFEYYKQLKPSDRGEYEITDIIKQYSDNHDLDFTFSDGWWSDAGEFASIDRVRDLIKQFPIVF
jgi:glucose-1-phosphate thymidylyltransferase